MWLWRYSGTLLVATGVLHCVCGVYIGLATLTRIGGDGVLNAILVSGVSKELLSTHLFGAIDLTTNVDVLQRLALFWFVFSGSFWIGTGFLCQSVIKRHGNPLPAHWGWFLVAFGALGCLLVPLSGFWLIVPQGVLVVLANRTGAPSA